MSNDLKTKGSHYKIKKITAAFAFISVVLFVQCKNANVKHEGFPGGQSDNYGLKDNFNNDDSASIISGTIKMHCLKDQANTNSTYNGF